MLLVCRFAVPESGVDAFVARARRALELLSAQPGCRGVRLARATEESERWMLVAEFDSVVAYRRALSPFEVREHVIPLLSEALADEPAAYEVLGTAEGGELRERPSLLARDAGSVRVGEAAAPSTEPR